MAQTTEDSRPVEGGSAQPVYVMNSTLPAGGGSGGVQPVSEADGADVALGAKADAAATTDAGTFSLIALFKRLLGKFTTQFPAALGQQTRAASFSVTQASDATGANAQQVQGTAAAGAAVVGNPNLLGISDGTNVQIIKQITSSHNTTGGGVPGVALMGISGSNFVQIGTNTGAGDGVSGGVVFWLQTFAAGYHWNGGLWDRARTPNIFKTITATAAGNTALWTPTSGKKFRLMGYIIQVSAFAASATPASEITFQDATTDMSIGTSLSLPVASAATGGTLLNTGQVQLGNGKLSAAANNVLNINLSAALTAGLVRVTVWGTEE